MQNFQSTNVHKEEVEFDLTQLIKSLRKHIKGIILTSVIFAIGAILITAFFIDKKYASTATVFITPKINEQGTIDSSTLTTNSKLVNNYMEIMRGENILSKVANQVEISSYITIKNSLSISNPTNSELIKVTATTKDPNLSQKIVESTISTFQTEMQEILDIKNLTVIDSPKVNEHSVSPNIKLNAIFGCLFGVFVSCIFVFLNYVLDKRLRNREEAEYYLGIPVLIEIPYFDED